MRRSRSWLLVLAACGSAKDRESSPPTSDPWAGSSGAPPAAPVASAAAGSAAIDEVNPLCATLFPPDDVRRTLGAGPLTPVPLRRIAGRADCALEAADGDQPLPVASLHIDCRKDVFDLDDRRSLSRGATTAVDGTYRDLALGRGGLYSKTQLLDQPTFSVGFFPAHEPCWVGMTTNHVAADHIEELAHLVDARLTSANYPRP